ncbi:MAG: hypothetical protein QXQ14_03460 [Candidatus Aenigmatarchaeota archaeon]
MDWLEEKINIAENLNDIISIINKINSRKQKRAIIDVSNLNQEDLEKVKLLVENDFYVDTIKINNFTFLKLYRKIINHE